VKVFLHESKEEQRQRLQERLDDPEKRWKFRAGDLDDRALWDDFEAAYEDAIRATSTEDAPWYVVPADHNWSRNLCVAEILVDALQRLDPELPEPVADKAAIV
jgi:polyphosphate kinase 2 (PPK2 family)